MKEKLLAVVCALLSSVCAAGISVIDGVLVIDLDLGTIDVSDEAISGLGAFSAIRKTGAGTAVLTGDSFKSFCGDIEIGGGTLGATSLAYFGAPTAGKTISVAESATLDLSSSDTGKYNFSTYRLKLAGTVRRDTSAVSGSGLGSFELAGDTVFEMPYGFTSWGSGKDYPLNGHVLRKTGTGALTFSGGEMSNGTMRIEAGSLTLQAGGTDLFRFLAGSDGGLLEFSGGGTLTMHGLSYENPSTAALHFKGESKATLACDPAADATRTSYNRWAGPVAVDSPLELFLRRDYSFVTFAGPFTNTAAITTSSNNKGTLILGGDGEKVVNANITIGYGRLEFGGGGVSIAKDVKIDANNAATVTFADAGTVTTAGTAYPFGGIRSDSGAASVARLTIAGKTVFADRTSALGAQSGVGVVDIRDGAIVSNQLSIGENGSALISVSDGFWFVGDSAGRINPNGRNGIGWNYYGGLMLSGGEISLNAGAASLQLGRNSTAEGVVAMSDGTWRSGALTIANKGYGNWDQTGGTACLRGGVSLCSTASTGDGAFGVLTVSGAGTVFDTTGGGVSPRGSSICGCDDASVSMSVVNIAKGGTVLASEIARGASTSGDSRFYLNFDGGVFAVTSPWQAIGTGDRESRGTAARLPDAVTVYGGGVVFDTSRALDGGGNPNTVYVAAELKAPEGQGFASISLPASLTDTTYAHHPRIYIEGDGEGASAVPVLDPATCRLTGIRVTSPGFGYTAANTRVYIACNTYKSSLADRRNAAIECTFTLTDNLKNGGVTKRGGANALNLYARNTYGGVTCCESGSIAFCSENAHPEGGGLDVWRGATIALFGDAQAGSLAGAGTITGGAVSGVSNVVIRAEDVFGADPSPLKVSAGLSLAEGAKLAITGIREFCSARGVSVSEFAGSMRRTALVEGTLAGNFASVELEGLTPEESALFVVSARADGVVIRSGCRGFMLILR